MASTVSLAADPEAGPSTAIICGGCGWQAPAAAAGLLQCPVAVPGDDVDHVLVRVLNPDRLSFPDGGEANPFVRYRRLFHAYDVALGCGWTDALYVELIGRLDRAVERVDGHGFRVTPFERQAALSDRLGFVAGGGVHVKDETGNVSGSHKARHLMGTLVELEVADAAATAREPGRAARAAGESGPAKPPLAIASCGNAALAAAVVARAAGRRLRVFIPPDAEPAVVARLRGLEAELAICERTASAGDPTYRRLLDELAAGAVAFTCQGNLNGLAIEGGETLGFELVDAVIAEGVRLDRLFIQVGGGALASACIRAFSDARALGVEIALPRIHAVQTRGAFPLARAYWRLADRLLGREPGAAEPSTATPTAEELARLREAVATPGGRDTLRYAVRHRHEFMWPWESEPRSVAHGILDDETYDWFAVVEGMLSSGGYPIVVDEGTLEDANAIGRSTTGIDVDHTGSAGLAGLLDLAGRGAVGREETVAVLFTGIRRDAPNSRGHRRSADDESSASRDDLAGSLPSVREPAGARQGADPAVSRFSAAVRGPRS